MKPIFKQPTTKWATLIVLGMVVTFFACKRTADVQSADETFGIEQAKEWYYGEFKKSNEFKNSLVKGKQLPNWEKGTYRKEGDFEIVEFPLLKNNTTISVIKDKSVASQGINQIINASLKKIAFIKNANNEIFVREFDYVPFWNYLQTKGFDISGLDFGSKNNDFTGMLYVKKWGGSFISQHACYNGKFYKKEKKVNNTNTSNQETNTQPCPLIELCTYTQTCEFELHGDVWVNTGICDDPVKGDCEPIDDPNCPPPNGGGGEEDPCEILGTCGGGGGGGVDCAGAEQEYREKFENYVSMETEGSISVDGPSSIAGSDPIADRISWTVAESSFGFWRVEAFSDYEYYKTSYMVITPSGALVNQNEYNITKFESFGSHFTGTHTLFESTWTQTGSALTQILNNNSSNARAKSRISGRIRHKSRTAIFIATCGITLFLDAESTIPGNELTFKPQ